ncbi:hypothetical protein [Streptomyces sp. NBC_01445]|uniref:hypothetical protein n=1 Tax=Streptomyces sp. NBC_01445 TaxID=2903869 RepID=UPI002DDA02AB|nr:hypothetical protein [Streptomyces sp. NBC_01445]WSE11207.1 hypothetical protein OG574_48895 [Streptomyces sp. NBC_01445]
MQADKRRIQTAVLGSADSEEPLLLPMEAIELDVFRHRYENDTFWCGTLLGGCGGQLTTKLYTDRACHFAHHPDPDGLPHVCGRRARGVNSADHLYVRSAAAAWLAGHGEQASFEYARTAGEPIGSVVDIRWQHGALRIHLDQAVAPVWDNGMEPVLGMGVPVDRDTLIRRWYVHRIRLESQGTTRQVRIGTEAFARTTEWFGLEDCEVTSNGLSTPAVQRIIQARSAPSPAKWTPGKKLDTAQGHPGTGPAAQAALRPPDRLHHPGGLGVPRDHGAHRRQPADPGPTGCRCTLGTPLAREGSRSPPGIVRQPGAGGGRAAGREGQEALAARHEGHQGRPLRG